MSIPLIEIYVETGSNAGKAYPVDPGMQQLTLGRSEPGRAEVDISFSDIGGASQSLLVSRQHLCVRVRSDGVYAEDLDSRNGTEVDGRPLSPRVEVPLRVGARIQLAPPEGPTLMVRERLAASGWGSVHEEIQLWQERYTTLNADYQQLQRSHRELCAKLEGKQVSLPVGSEIEWQRCHGKILDSLERLTVIRQLLVDAAVDPKVHGNVERVRTNLAELRSLLKLDTP